MINIILHQCGFRPCNYLMTWLLFVNSEGQESPPSLHLNFGIKKKIMHRKKADARIFTKYTNKLPVYNLKWMSILLNFIYTLDISIHRDIHALVILVMTRNAEANP